MALNYPSYVKECFGRLALAGYPAYLVGGCVRDHLMGRTPGDYDMCTPATPEQILSVFPRCVPTGISHGTVTVVCPQGQVELTTFRAESGYTDGRHPDRVRFVSSLTQDLARRDFTVNAMAMGFSGRIYDPFGGKSDLRAKQLRCVGDPTRRFREDSLRILRGVRFAAQLGFCPVESTLSAMASCAHGIGRLSAERVGGEVERTLLAPWPEWGNLWFSLDLLADYVNPSHPIDLRPLKALPAEEISRWAGFCQLLFQSGASTGAGELARRMKRSGRVIRACAAGEAVRAAGFPSRESQWRQVLYQYGPDGASAAAAMGELAHSPGSLAMLEQAKRSGCWRPEDLALSGKALLALGLRGPAIGQAQRRLLAHVLLHPEDNTPSTLTEWLK